MKTTLLKLTAFLLIIAGNFVSCGKENNAPVEIPFTEYSLDGTLCQWTNLGYNDEVIIINSSAALESYLTNTDGGYPIIDFSKQTLLLVSGEAANGIRDISQKLQQVSTKYVLDIEITLNEATFAQEWVIALVTSKLNESKNIELNITSAYGEIDFPIEIPFRECSLDGTSCQWINFESNKAIIINSDEEFQGYITCTDYNYSEINFLKHSLLLAKGMASSSPAGMRNMQLQQISDNEYSLYLEILPGPMPSIGTWRISIIIPKLFQNAIVALDVRHYPFNK